MPEEPIIETRNIETRAGTMVVEMTQSFMDRVRLQFDLGARDLVTDDQVRMFVWGAVDGALKKAESTTRQ